MYLKIDSNYWSEIATKLATRAFSALPDLRID
jgi:hypothetical protein